VVSDRMNRSWRVEQFESEAGTKLKSSFNPISFVPKSVRDPLTGLSTDYFHFTRFSERRFLLFSGHSKTKGDTS
jgi:hypothetical protein